MSDANTSAVRSFVAREWAYLFCVCFVVVALFASAQRKEAHPALTGQTEAERKRFEEVSELPDPLPAVVFGHVVLAAILCSYVWLIGRQVRGEGVFPPARGFPIETGEEAGEESPVGNRGTATHFAEPKWDGSPGFPGGTVTAPPLPSENGDSHQRHSTGSCRPELVEGRSEQSERRRACPPFSARWNEWDVLKLVFVLAFFMIVLSSLPPLRTRSGLLAIDSAAKLLTALVAFDMIRRLGQEPRDALGLRLRGSGLWVAAGLAVFLAFVPLLVGVSVGWQSLLHRLVGEEVQTAQDPVVWLVATLSVPVLVQTVIAAVVVAPFAEEVFFRGLLYGAIRRRLPAALAIPLGGALFGVFHWPVAAMVPMAALGILLCYLYERTGRLVVTMTIHFLFNFSTVALILSHRLLNGGGV